MWTRPLTESCELVLVQGDLTRLEVDAIVNAANPRMLGGGGVDGAIHRAAGPQLREACREVAQVTPGVRCPTGEARITPGFELAARYVIHTVGPIYSAHPRPAEALASCHREALRLAREVGCTEIAFPAISTGVFGYPVEEAAKVALETVRDHAQGLLRVWFALFGATAWTAFREAADELG